MTTHDLKCWPESFAALLSGEKRHEIRKNDRAYAVGDVLHLREWDPHEALDKGRLTERGTEYEVIGYYTGRTLDLRVTHLTPGGAWGLPADLCVMSVERVADDDLFDLERAVAVARDYDKGVVGTGKQTVAWLKARSAIVDAAPDLIRRVREAEAEVARLARWKGEVLTYGFLTTEQRAALSPAIGSDVQSGALWAMEAARLLAARDTLIAEQAAEIERLRCAINTPQIVDWIEAVRVEAVHQRERWGVEHDAGKTNADWFWLLGYLAGKALHAATHEKRLHHTISAGAALLNWHAALTGADTRMRPGIDPAAAKEPG